ncbi:cytochrome P450 [Anopheles darlingi]|uniref:Cytochrome P450 n=1 Tax=Anopheles darlingi TaxID=43151 RepID=W5JQT6_ANODA|nr:cytochrome P450 [Anopheles darlingi]
MWIYLLLLVLLAAIYWVRQRLAYWKRRGVAYVEPSFPQGNLQGVGKQHHIAQVLQRCYRQLKATSGGPYGGMYFFINPVALLLDLDLIKAVLVKDFQYFHDRNLYHNDRDDPLSRHLVAMEGTKWKNLRAKLTPTFTSGKMKLMFSTVTAVADEFTSCLSHELERSTELEMKDLLARFTTDVIGTVAFGLECNSLADPQAKFRMMGRKIFEPSPSRVMKNFLASQFPGLARMLRVVLTPTDITDFFMTVVKDTVQFREKNNVQRNDFMTLLMKVMKDQEQSGTAGTVGERLTMDDMAAQAFVFFLAGFETSSTTMSFCLYELALNQAIQDRARQEVRDVLQQHDSISYEAVHEMKYIEMCINESLRKYPPATTLTRKVTKDYRIGNGNQVLPKGLMVAVPVYALHHDPDYFPEPDRFDPERFSAQQTEKRHPFAFLPFGEGPRVCIGLRFGMMQARIGLVYLLKHFRFTLASKMSVPLKVTPSSPILSIDGGLWLNVEKL